MELIFAFEKSMDTKAVQFKNALSAITVHWLPLSKLTAVIVLVFGILEPSNVVI